MGMAMIRKRGACRRAGYGPGLASVSNDRSPPDTPLSARAGSQPHIRYRLPAAIDAPTIRPAHQQIFKKGEP